MVEFEVAVGRVASFGRLAKPWESAFCGVLKWYSVFYEIPGGFVFSEGASMIPLELLLSAYKQGVFPMAEPGGEISWFSPDPRGILPLEEFYLPHGLKRALKKGLFEIRINTAFEAVLEGCANRPETWIDARIKASYTALYHLGLAHSVEAWVDGALGGGLYGVSLGGVFFGESMFHTVTDASKVALVALVERMRARGMGLLDLQWVTPHLLKFGAREVPRRVYLKLLSEQLDQPCGF
ncbi:MAG: leucyl/phenylalanyl-tRNA--protein transferase [Verrucomicrobia bacterium]|nr:MAG: leucyl/phenylalanyl-tRNA--protein transferase [Verrucomicrobiota bacterium]